MRDVLKGIGVFLAVASLPIIPIVALLALALFASFFASLAMR